MNKVFIGAVEKNKIIRTPNGKVIALSYDQIKKNVTESIKFWNSMRDTKGFEKEAKRNLSFWKFIAKQL